MVVIRNIWRQRITTKYCRRGCLVNNALLGILAVCTSMNIIMTMWSQNAPGRATRKSPPTCRWYENSKRRSYSCYKLIEGDKEEQELFPKGYSLRQPIPDIEFLNLTRDCDLFKQDRCYILDPGPSEEEQNFPLSFSILAYHHVDQVERLLRAIYRRQNIYCIHVDARAKDDFKTGIQAVADCFPNVFIASKHTVITYASYSQVDAELTCMEDNLRKNHKWKYHINLTGEMFPLKTVLEMIKILRLFNMSNDVTISSLKHDLSIRWKNRFFLPSMNVHGNQVWKCNKVPIPHNQQPPYGLTILKGSAFGAFSRPFVNYILYDNHSITLRDFLKTSYSPDESYMMTLNHLTLNPQLDTPGGYKGPLMPEPKAMTSHSLWWDCDKSRHSICIPNLLDLPRLVTRREMFVNKLLPFTHDHVVLECLDEWIRNMTWMKQPFKSHWYSKLPIVARDPEKTVLKQLD